MTELVTFGETPLRLSAPGNNRLVTTDRADLQADGEESNVAVAASCLGVDTTWVSRLPDTPVGRRIPAALRRHGVTTDVIWTDDGRVGLVYYEAGADPRSVGLWHDRSGTSAAGTRPADIPVERVQEADVVFSGLATPALSEAAAETAEAVISAGVGGGALAALDVDYDPSRHDPDFIGQLFRGLVPRIDIVFATEEHARSVLDVSGQPRELANTLVAEHDLDMAVITRSEYGAVLMRDTPGTSVIHERDTIESQTVDPTGTREAFVGSFLAQFAATGDAAEALNYGVASAAIARTLPGPLLTATPAEIDSIAARVQETAR
jgi:2-dehydro-3-deoxygluconokinase